MGLGERIRTSFPDVPLVIGYFVAVEELEKLLLEGHSAVMLLLS